MLTALPPIVSRISSICADQALHSTLRVPHRSLRFIWHARVCAYAQSDMALAGGVNLILSPEVTIAFSHARMMASDGRCKTFDAKADGYVRGEGCGRAGAQAPL